MDRINLKSRLSQLITILALVKDGQIEISRIETESIAEESKIFRFLIYEEVKK